MSLKCFFLGHKWKYFSHYNYRDTSFKIGHDDTDFPRSNCVTKTCEHCGKMKVFYNYGGGFYEKEKPYGNGKLHED
jgi:hypothetical protein